MHYLLIVNTNSRRYKKIKNNYDKIKKIFDSAEEKIDIRYSIKISDTEKYIKYAKDNNYYAVIIAGGDGAINLAVNILHNTGIKIGVIPTGTVNVFAKEARIPLLSIAKAVRVILRDYSVKFDTGVINGKTHFLIMAGAGIDGFATKMKDHFYKKIFGRISYIIAALVYFIKRRPDILVRLKDTGLVDKCGSIIIGNMHKYGGRFNVTYLADPCDGRLDLLLLKSKHLPAFLKYFIGVIFKQHLKYSDVSYYQSSSIVLEPIRSYEKVYYQIDGEPSGELPIDITVAKKSIEIIVQKKYYSS